MAISLFTGLPGHGKTLFTLKHVKDWAERENRPVYYAHINELMLPWTLIDADKWMDCPANSIIVIDECQKLFRPRANGGAVPDYVAALETHRHKGVDIVLITQHPMLCDNAVRRLTDTHRHIVRKWGTQSATVHQWTGVRENCEKPAGRVDSDKSSFGYPKEVYSYYKSAEVHTVKRSIPKRVFFFLFLCAALLAIIYAGYRIIGGRVMGKTSVPEVAQSVPSSTGQSAGPVRASYKDAVSDAKQYVFDRTPRVADLPATAPRYDEITKASVAPVPAACVYSKLRGCVCYTQQGTKMEMSVAVCLQIVEHGFFEDFERNGGRQNGSQQAVAQAPANHSASPLVAADAVRIPSAGTAPAVGNTASLEDGYGVLGKRGLRAPQYR